jgi:hypothetical protein
MSFASRLRPPQLTASSSAPASIEPALEIAAISAYPPNSQWSATSAPNSSTIGISSQPSTRRQPAASELPPRSSQRKQIANVEFPPLLSTQQSPQTGLRQRAQGPTASAEHSVHSASPPSWLISWPVTSEAYHRADLRVSAALLAAFIAVFGVVLAAILRG